MTEAEWLASEDPAAMLRHLTHERNQTGVSLVAGIDVPRKRPLASDRKLRLWIEACRKAASPKLIPSWDLNSPDGLRGAIRDWCHAGQYKEALPLAARAALLREIFGNPFSNPSWYIHRCCQCGQEGRWQCKNNGKPWPKCPDCQVDMVHRVELCRRWDGGTVMGLAHAIYLGRTFAELTVLADALEEAGCDNEDMLGHLRQRYRCKKCGKDVSHLVGENPAIYGGCLWCGSFELEAMTHVRGCWVLDLILGKE